MSSSYIHKSGVFFSISNEQVYSLSVPGCQHKQTTAQTITKKKFFFEIVTPHGRAESVAGVEVHKRMQSTVTVTKRFLTC
jgi:hypothetical protein